MLPQNARAGLLLALAAILIFAAQDGVSKHLAANYPPVFVVMVRYWAFALFVLVWATGRPGGLRAVARTSQPVLQVARGALLGLQVVIAITAFAVVGLVPTMALFAAAPLVVAALSVPVLGETVGWRRWTAIAVGFCGVMVILRPGPGMLTSDIWMSLVAMIGIAIYSVMTRLASRKDRAETSFFYTGIGGVAVLTLIGPFFWTGFEGWDWAWMGFACVTGAAGHYFLIRAFEVADAVVIQPVTYLQIVFGAITGIVVFDEALEWPVLLGAGIVLGAGLFSAWRDFVRSRAARG